MELLAILAAGIFGGLVGSHLTRTRKQENLPRPSADAMAAAYSKLLEALTIVQDQLCTAMIAEEEKREIAASVIEHLATSTAVIYRLRYSFGHILPESLFDAVERSLRSRLQDTWKCRHDELFAVRAEVLVHARRELGIQS